MSPSSGRSRVTFAFGRAMEVRYLDCVPKVGDYVTNRRELWVVSRVEPDHIDLLVTCVRPRVDEARTRPA